MRFLLIVTGTTITGAITQAEEKQLKTIEKSFIQSEGDAEALAQAYATASHQIDLLTSLTELESNEAHRKMSELLQAKENEGVRHVVAEFASASDGSAPNILAARAKLDLKKIERYTHARKEERIRAQRKIEWILDQRLNPSSALEREEKVRLSTIIDTYRGFSGDENALEGAYTEASSQIDLLTNLPESERAEAHRQLSGLLEAKGNAGVRQVVAEYVNAVSHGLNPKLLKARARLVLKKIERYSYANEEERRAAQHTIESILSEGAPELPPVRKHRSASSGLGNFNTAEFEEIVIIPDVHGDAEYFIHSLWIAFKNVEPAENSVTFRQFDRALRNAAASVKFPEGRPSVLPESRLSMRGERIALVQLGDIMDRGPQSWLSYKLLASLDHVIGWKKVQLFGNHELMAYVRPGVFDLRYNIEPTDISNDEAMIQFAPGGPLMTYLINNNLLMARFGSPIDSSREYVVDPSRKADTLFVHAGLDNEWADSFKNAAGIERWEDFIDSINRMKRREFQEKPERVSKFAWEKKSPVYTRTIPEPETGDEFRGRCGELQKILEKLQVSRVIVGHTPEVKNVRRYCDSKFIVSDVAMSRGMGPGAGNPFAMVMSLDDSGSDVSALKYYYGVPGAVNQPPEISTIIDN